jgi:hypothetical protein
MKSMGRRFIYNICLQEQRTEESQRRSDMDEGKALRQKIETLERHVEHQAHIVRELKRELEQKRNVERDLRIELSQSLLPTGQHEGQPTTKSIGTCLFGSSHRFSIAMLRATIILFC